MKCYSSRLIFVVVFYVLCCQVCIWSFTSPIQRGIVRFTARDALFSHKAHEQNQDSPQSIRERSSRGMLTNCQRLLRILPATVLTTVIALQQPSSSYAAAGNKEAEYLDALAAMILAKKVMEPTKQYVTKQAYDSARSNIKFILNDLQLQKKVTNLIQNSIDFSDDMDSIENAQEAVSRVANTAIQYDSTVYTCVFIPSDDGAVPPNAEKYRKQAYDFYDSFNNDIDLILKIANEEQLNKANQLADKKLQQLPPVLFKSTDNIRSTGI